MTALADRANSVFRDFATDGVPSSGPNNPAKSDIRSLFALADSSLSSIGAGIALGNAILYATLASLNGDLAHPDGILGIVFNDSTVANDGVYVKVGASGSGSWAKTALTLPAGYLDSIAASIAAEGQAARTDAAGFTTTWSVRRFGFRGNLFDPVRSIANTAVFGGNGGTYGSSGVTATGLIAVEPGSTLLVNKPMHSYAFYDRTATGFVSGFESSGTDYPAAQALPVPGTARFFQTAVPNTDILGDHASQTPPLYVSAEGALPVIPRAFGYNRVTRWTGKRIGWLADSQFARTLDSNGNPVYKTQPATCFDLGAIDSPFQNDCVSGRRWGDCLSGGSSPALTSAAIAPLDQLIILLGANDWDVPANPPGAYSDTSSANTCAGNIRAVYETIRSLNTGIRITTLLPNKRGTSPNKTNKSYKDTNTYGWNLEQYVNLIKTIAADYGSPTVDLFKDLPFTDATFLYYSDDRIHLNYTVGQPMMADFLAGRLRWL